MPRKRRPNKYVYRTIVFAGVAAVKLFRIRVTPSGLEHLPAGEDIRGLNRKVVPGRGAVVAITHFGYLDFVFAEYLIWKQLKVHMRFLVTKKAARKKFVATVCDWCEHIVVDRSDGAAAYRESVEKLHAGDWLAVLPEAPASPGGATLSGLLIPATRRVWVNAEEARRSAGRRRFTIAHELGHWRLHCDAMAPQMRFCRSDEIGVEGHASARAAARSA